MPRPSLVTRTPLLPALWIWLGAWASCSGWMLSAAHRLDATGYLLALLLGGGVCVFAWKRGAFKNFQPPSLHRFKRRMIRPLPLAFAILTMLVFLGGALYFPSNYDGIAYRTPRVLHWLAEGRWHWIHTDFQRLNTRATGFEWLTTPLIALTKTDKLVFLINTVSFALLPGLVFSVFTRLNIRRKAVWHWMWLVPSGYCYVLQAGSIGNDLLGAAYALAAMDFALRASASRRLSELWLSILAAALLTGAKASNLPLLLPWCIAVWPCASLLWKKPLLTALIAAIAALVSFLPMATINYRQSGDWTGAVAEGLDFRARNLTMRLGGNLAIFGIDNLLPPFFPTAQRWNTVMLPELVSVQLRRQLDENFMSGLDVFKMGEMANEESAGLGMGIWIFLCLSAVSAWKNSHCDSNGGRNGKGRAWFIAASTGFAMLIFMSKSYVGSGSRLLTPYYALLAVPFLLMRGHVSVVCRRWWRWGAGTVFAVSASLLVLTPPRPLFPARTLFDALRARVPSSRFMERAQTVYTIYGLRGDSFAPVRATLPPGVKVLGMITFDDPETSLWRPFGSRRIEHVLPTDTPEDLAQHEIHYVLINTKYFVGLFKETLDEWMHRQNATLITKMLLTLRASDGASEWLLVSLSPANAAKPQAPKERSAPGFPGELQHRNLRQSQVKTILHNP